MTNEYRRIIQNEFGDIFKNIKRQQWRCIECGCTNTAINSHLLQRNGILNYVAEDGKVVMIKLKSMYGLKWGEAPATFQKIGVKEALSYNIFCRQHDSNLFKEIEDGEVDYYKYRHCALFFYRSLCAETRLKEIEREKFNLLLNSEKLTELGPEQAMMKLYYQSMTLEMGLMDLEAYRSWIYEDLHNNTESFVFESFEIPINGIFASAISNTFATEEEIMSPDLAKMLFIQIIPQKEKSRIMFGYHKQYHNKNYETYIERWRNAKVEKLGYMLTGILIQLANWGMSPSLYEKLLPQNIETYYSLFWKDYRSLNQYPDESFNLFEGIF